MGNFGDDRYNPLLQILFFGIWAPKISDPIYPPVTQDRLLPESICPDPFRSKTRFLEEVVAAFCQAISATPDVVRFSLSPATPTTAADKKRESGRLSKLRF